MTSPFRQFWRAWGCTIDDFSRQATELVKSGWAPHAELGYDFRLIVRLLGPEAEVASHTQYSEAHGLESQWAEVGRITRSSLKVDPLRCMASQLGYISDSPVFLPHPDAVSIREAGTSVQLLVFTPVKAPNKGPHGWRFIRTESHALKAQGDQVPNRSGCEWSRPRGRLFELLYVLRKYTYLYSRITAAAPLIRSLVPRSSLKGQLTANST